MLDLETIQILIAEALSLPKDVVISKGRRRDISDARSLFIHFAHLQGHDLKDVVKLVGLQNRHVAQYHLDKIKDMVPIDQPLRKRYQLCSEKIKSFKTRPGLAQ